MTKNLLESATSILPRSDALCPAGHPSRRGAARGLRAACLLACSVALLATMPGCIAIVAGAGAGTAVAYSAGKLSTEVPANLEKTEKATRTSIRQLGFAPINENLDALGAVFVCRTSTDKRVRIELGREGDGITKVEIRVGFLGDAAVSLGALEKIRANLDL